MSDFRTDNLLRTLPQVLKNDKAFHAFASVMAKQLRSISDDIDYATIYARIDALPEDLLDVLAYDFKVDWWDYGYSVEQKRQTLKDSFLVHKHLGTKFAVQTAISAIYPNTAVEEWFEWGGDPYTFRLLIDVSGILVEQNRHTRVLELANYYKNLRSHLCGIQYTVEAKEPATLRMGGQLGSVVKICIPEIADEFSFKESVCVGGSVSAITSLHIPSVPDDFAFENIVYAGGRIGTVASINLPAAPDTIEFTHTGRVGGRVANITTITIPDPQEDAADGQ